MLLEIASWEWTQFITVIRATLSYPRLPTLERRLLDSNTLTLVVGFLSESSLGACYGLHFASLGQNFFA